MSVAITGFLRRVLYADIAFSTGGALMMAAGAASLSPALNLPFGLLCGAGLVLVPWVAALVRVVRRETVQKPALACIAVGNLLWCAACFGLLASGGIAPNGLGVAFVVAQALAVALLAVLQVLALRGAAASG